MSETSLEQAPDLASGKGHKDENFPVASFIIKPRHRALVMGFYRFARKADDIADHPSAPADEKLALLERMRATLAGEADSDPEALALRRAEDERGLAPQHGLDLLEAFRRDVTKTRYADWGELMDYCRYSAMPVGRFVLDVHGESRELWPASDALCAALQVINHLQDCAKDHAALDRVYVPLDALAAAGTDVSALASPKAAPALRWVIIGLAERTASLLDESRPFAKGVKDQRLAYEVALIQRLAESLTLRLRRCDPLSERVHHTKLETLGLLGLAAKDRLIGRRDPGKRAA
ncbi:MAG: squalene synthase HpnC [Caulobacteraceae bacterium]|nr:squalene synthase HpnC [Caulobacteraceae bacterium]